MHIENGVLHFVLYITHIAHVPCFILHIDFFCNMAYIQLMQILNIAWLLYITMAPTGVHRHFIICSVCVRPIFVLQKKPKLVIFKEVETSSV